MKQNHKECYRGFTQLSRTWYGKADLTQLKNVLDEITFGYYFPEGGTCGEMTVRWIELCGKYTPELKIFSDAWNVLSNIHDFIDVLGQHNNEDTTPEEFIKYLLQCGFKNMTE